MTNSKPWWPGPIISMRYDWATDGKAMRAALRHGCGNGFRDKGCRHLERVSTIRRSRTQRRRASGLLAEVPKRALGIRAFQQPLPARGRLPADRGDGRLCLSGM